MVSKYAKAVVMAAPGRLEIQEFICPEIDEDSMLIATEMCGICGTDLHGTESHETALPSGTIPGHEYVGEVVASGKAVEKEWKTGTKVTGLPFYSCGSCGRVPKMFLEGSGLGLDEEINKPKEDALSRPDLMK